MAVSGDSSLHSSRKKFEFTSGFLHLRHFNTSHNKNALKVHLVCQILLSLSFLALTVPTCGQDNEPVSWSCQWNNTSGNEGTLVVAANLDPGWHLYSQHIDDGGPIPTRLNFTKTDDFELVGQPQEKGSAFTYYDSLYEMNIKWYSYEVGFLQKVRLKTSKAKIQCEIIFMVCNDNECIPMREKFTIPVVAARQSDRF